MTAPHISLFSLCFLISICPPTWGGRWKMANHYIYSLLVFYFLLLRKKGSLSNAWMNSARGIAARAIPFMMQSLCFYARSRPRR